MPGAPNRPPSNAPVPAAAPPGAEAARPVLRRLAPSRVALRQEVWKGAPPPELLAPFEKAEAAYAAGDFGGASGHLDQLATRFAEPRWPTLPAPFRELRVSIPAPQPPSWNPDHALAPEEKEARQRRRAADQQLAWATASVEWMGRQGLETADLAERLVAARQALEAAGATDALWNEVDTIWVAVHERVPAPRPAAAARPPAAPPPPPAATET